MNLPPYITQFSGPSYSQSGSTQQSYDYSGADDLVKRQDAVTGLRADKFGALYGGDIPGSVQAASRIRGLLDAIREHDARASESRPIRYVTPISRVSSSSTSSSQSGSGSSLRGTHSLYGSEGSVG